MPANSPMPGETWEYRELEHHPTVEVIQGTSTGLVLFQASGDQPRLLPLEVFLRHFDLVDATDAGA